MFCSSCGKQLNDGARFCPYCGSMQNAVPSAPQTPVQPKAVYPPAAPQAPVQQQPVVQPPVQQSAPAKKKSKLPLIIGLAAGGAALLILGIVLAAVLLGRGSGKLEKNYAYVTNDMIIVGEEGIFGDLDYVLTNGKNINISLGPDSPYPAVYDEFSKTDGFYIQYPLDTGWDADGGTLYRFDKNGVTQVADKIDHYRESADGSTMFYAQRAPFYSESEPTVHLHVNRNGKDTDFEMMDYLADFCVSPDGSAIFYSGNDSLSFKYCVYVNGKKTELPDDFKPGYVTGISNDGKTIFYVNESYDGFYVWDDGDTIRLGNQDYYGSMTRYFNLDCTQVLYQHEDETYFWSQGDDEKVKISSDPLYLLIPYRALYWGITGDTFEHTVGIKDFRNIFLIGDNSICYFLDSHQELRTVIRDYTTIQLAEDGKTLVVLKRGKLYKFDGTREYKDPSSTEIGSGYQYFAMTGDAKEIYALDSYADLYYLDGSGKAVMIGESLTNAYFYGVSSLTTDGLLYYISHGDIYCAKGGSVSQITGFEGDAVNIYPSCNLAGFSTVDGNSSYYYNVYPDGTVHLVESWD